MRGWGNGIGRILDGITGGIRVITGELDVKTAMANNIPPMSGGITGV
jgi:hypothetical protein